MKRWLLTWGCGGVIIAAEVLYFFDFFWMLRDGGWGMPKLFW